MAKYQWMKLMGACMAQLRKEGKPLPKSVEEMESTLGGCRRKCDNYHREWHRAWQVEFLRAMHWLNVSNA